MALVPVDEAERRILEGAGPLGAERVSLSEAGGRALAAPVAALRTQPPFAASAMDGYAVRAADVAQVPARLAVIGMAAAGKLFPGRLGQGEAVRIFTGAPVPEGADTIAIQENVRSVGDAVIEVMEGVAPGRHIRARGLDFVEGDALLAEGRVLDAAALSLAASANHAFLDVVRRPLVAIVATGDELLPPGSTPGPDQIISSNNHGVAAIARDAGAAVLDLGIARDTHQSIGSLVDEALQAGADIIVTLGGASVGDHDLVHDVLTAHGMTLDFWKIAMRPGKPLMFGRLGAVRCLGLPGNPVASLICSHLFLKPLVTRLSGLPFRQELRPARLAAPMTANDLRQDYVRASVRETGEGLEATPFAIQDSSMMRILAEAQGLVVRVPFAPAAAAGDPCTVLMLR